MRSSPAALPLLAWLLPLAAAVLAYSGALHGGFVYDDLAAIVEQPAFATGHWWQAAFGPDHTPLANRPLPCLTFAIDHALWGADAGGYRATNLLLHLGNVLLLLGVVRRSLLAPNLGGRFTAPHAAWLASAIALLWACHPLGCDAVAYVTQRTTLLMSFGFLAALYCRLRDAAAPSRSWRLLAVLALMLGMASKEELVAAPLLLLLFDRAFLFASFRALRPQLPFYLGLASSWLVLAACIALGPDNPTVGTQALVAISPLEWLYTQASVLAHYLRLALWPWPLRAVYDWDVVRSPSAAFAPGLLVLALLALTLWLWRRRPHWSWLSAMFFLLLAPTSSVMPIITELAAERRMYLPMLAVLIPLATLADRALATLRRRGLTAASQRALAAALLAAAAVPSILATRAHAEVFTSEAAFWADAVRRNELQNGSLLSATILAGQARVLHEQGRRDESFALLQRAMQCRHKLDKVRRNYAVGLADRGDFAAAERELRSLLAEQPRFADASGLLAKVLADAFERDLAAGAGKPDDPRLGEAASLAERAFQLSPKPAYLNTLGMVRCRQGRLDEAHAALRRAIEMAPGFLEAYRNLGGALLLNGQPEEAVQVWGSLLPKLPQDVGLRMNLVVALLRLGDKGNARGLLQEVLRLQPGHAQAQQLLRELDANGR